MQQIIKAILDPEYGWQNHPAVNMWRGYEIALAHYGMCCYDEWRKRKNDCSAQHKSGEFIQGALLLMSMNLDKFTMQFPNWLGNENFHISHQSNLIRKDAEFYGPQFPGIPGDLPYVWPSKDII